MNKQNYLHFIASFLMVLVFTIPFYTASVYAAINKVTIKGGDGIEGFARSSDFLSVNAQASIAGDTITSNQVVLGSSTQFNSCAAAANNGSDCSLRLPGNGTDSFEAKSVPFTVSLFRDDGTLDDTESGSVTIDNKAPSIKVSSAGKFSSQQNIVVDYDATDFACDDPSCANKCVGIKSIELFTSDNSFKQTIVPSTSDCNVKSSITVDSKTFDNGRNSVFAKAIDKFNQESAVASATFDVDSGGPEIMTSSFEILRKGISISTFSSSAVDVEVSINISGDDLDLNSVRADLSALNPSQNLKNSRAACSAVEDETSTCIWKIDLNPAAGGLKNIVINASDNSGNKESAAISKFLSLDEDGPVAISLSTGSEKEGQTFAKASGNTIIAAFDEATGLMPEDVFLNVGGGKLRATSCSKDSNWFCIWENVNFAGSKITVDPESLDIFGIDASGDVSLDIAVDPKAPIARTINITPIGGLVQAFPGFAKIGDKIAVVANVTEENDVFAVADFSSFVDGASRVAGSCERIQADEHVCTWLSDSINLASSGTIEFNFSDNAGNTLIVSRSFKTFGIENATVPDFWTSFAGCSPSTIDRQLGPLISQRVYCQIVLRPKSFSKPVSTVFIGPATCSGNGSSIIQNVETFNTEVGSKSPVIKITLKKDDLKINSADLSCSFDIFSKIGASSTITKNPEIENANVRLEFFNNPLGELGNEVNDKIKEAKKDAEGIWELIGTLNKIVYWAKKICTVINTIFNIVSILYFVWAFIKVGELTCEGSVVANLFGACTAIYTQATGKCEGVNTAADSSEKLYKGLNWACDVVNCKQTPLWGPKVKEFINNDLPLALSPGQYVGSKTVEGESTFGFSDVKPIEVKGTDDKSMKLGRPISEYMDPQRNLLVATLFACLPGIIYGLDKYRQIKCLYADCLKNAVGQEGLPITACEDQKAYATCKYITSELFAIFPWTAVFDHFMKLIKNAMSNPFGVLGIAASVLCGSACPVPAAIGGQAMFHTCRGIRLLNLVGETAGNVKSIIDQGFTIREDYCARLEDDGKGKKIPAAATPTSTANPQTSTKQAQTTQKTAASQTATTPKK